jgi:hypothetical protein
MMVVRVCEQQKKNSVGIFFFGVHDSKPQRPPINNFDQSTQSQFNVTNKLLRQFIGCRSASRNGGGPGTRADGGCATLFDTGGPYSTNHKQKQIYN